MSGKTRIFSLYRRILREHSKMPHELRMLGDLYVKDEFRRHRGVEPHYVSQFVEGWTQYAEHLEQSNAQAKTTQAPKYGCPIGRQLDQLSDEQVQQLYVLKEETSRPRDASV